MLKKILFFIGLSMMLLSCNYFSPKDSSDKDIVAKVGESVFYKTDLIAAIPENLDKQDSVLFAKKAINSWAKQELFYQKAKINLSEEQSEIEKLVKKYKQDLLINKYKKALIAKNLDTTITENNIAEFYKENKDIFKLNEQLIQFQFIQIPKETTDLKEIISLFNSNERKNLDSLKNKELEFKAFHLQDSMWVKLSDVNKVVPQIKKINLNKVKLNKPIKIEDSADIFLFKIHKILNRNQIAPKDYVKPTIKQMILHDRKLNEQKNIEKTILNDAIKNGKFQIYE